MRVRCPGARHAWKRVSTARLRARFCEHGFFRDQTIRVALGKYGFELQSGVLQPVQPRAIRLASQRHQRTGLWSCEFDSEQPARCAIWAEVYVLRAQFLTKSVHLQIDRPAGTSTGRSCFCALALAFLVFAALPTVAQVKIKVIVDQDARGPGTSDQQAILVFLQLEKFEVLGIATVSGDQWVKEETQHVLRLLEITDRSDVPVIAGAEFPLLNSKEETERWEALYGRLEYKGCWTERFEAQRSTIYDEPYHAPDVIPPMKEGAPHIHAQPGTAAEFIVQMVHRYPGEVVLWAGGPLTNYALALKLDPSVATLAKEFVLMGGGLYPNKEPIDPGALDPRREFNWWFDPEAARIVLRAPWKKMTITPIDISVKTRYTLEMKAAIAKASTPIT